MGVGWGGGGRKLGHCSSSSVVPLTPTLSLWAAGCGWASLLQSSVRSRPWLEAEGIPSPESSRQRPGSLAVLLHQRARQQSRFPDPPKACAPWLFRGGLGLWSSCCPSEPWSVGSTSTGAPPALTLQLGAVSGIHRCSSLPAPSRGCWAQETRHLKRLGPPKLPEQWDPTPAGEARGRGMGAGRRQARLLLGTSGLTAGWRLGEQPGSWSACQQRAPRAAHSESSDSRGHLPTGPGRLDGPRPCWSL